MNQNVSKFIFLILIGGLLLQSCSLFRASEDILYDQTGILIWGGSPAVDGAGILFETENEVYGAPGDREDYIDYFREDESQVEIIADIKITGDTTVRGWGAEFPEIHFKQINRIE